MAFSTRYMGSDCWARSPGAAHLVALRSAKTHSNPLDRHMPHGLPPSQRVFFWRHISHAWGWANRVRHGGFHRWPYGSWKEQYLTGDEQTLLFRSGFGACTAGGYGHGRVHINGLGGVFGRLHGVLSCETLMTTGLDDMMKEEDPDRRRTSCPGWDLLA